MKTVFRNFPTLLYPKSLLIMIYHTVSKQNPTNSNKNAFVTSSILSNLSPHMFTGHGEAVECDGADVAGLAGSADATL